MRSETACLVCGSSQLTTVIDLDSVPVQCSRLIPTREEALRVETGRIELVYCEDCSHIFNRAFQPDLVRYDGAYENSLDCSPFFQEYIEHLAADLVGRYALKGRTVVEVGCGQAGFLKAFARLGVRHCIGFDPTFTETAGSPAAGTEGVHVFRQFFTEHTSISPIDLLCCRQTLEHISDLSAFMKTLLRAIRDSGSVPVFFEVPNAAAILQNNAVWDIIYPHVSYFSATSLARFFQQAGFSVRDIRDTFSGQFLCLEASRRSVRQSGPAQVSDSFSASVRSFSANYRETLIFWRESLAEMSVQGKTAVVWGSGAKGVSFLNAIGTDSGVDFVVDINPRRQGRFIPATGQQIVAPDFLKRYRPDAVILMNPVYAAEVQATLSGLGLRCEMFTADAAGRAVGAERF